MFCSRIDDECPYRIQDYIVDPIDGDYISNLLNVAEIIGGERTLDFYTTPWHELKEILAKYKKETLEDNEAALHYNANATIQLIWGANFCARESSGYRLVNEKLYEAIDAGDKTFSVAERIAQIKSNQIDEGYTQHEIVDLWKGSNPGVATISRILISCVDDADKLIHIKSCSISPYFPELIRLENTKVAEVDKVFGDGVSDNDEAPRSYYG